MSSGEPLKCTNWHGTNPDKENKKCGSIFQFSLWNSWGCHEKAVSICEKDATKMSDVTTKEVSYWHTEERDSHETEEQDKVVILAPGEEYLEEYEKDATKMPDVTTKEVSNWTTKEQDSHETKEQDSCESCEDALSYN